jgi:hypothetical protein
MNNIEMRKEERLKKKGFYGFLSSFFFSLSPKPSEVTT